MSKLHGKSVLLGMGIGIILTALLGIIFFLGYTPEMDAAKVKELARGYGMIEPDELHRKLVIDISGTDTLSDITSKLTDAGLVKDAVAFQIMAASRKLQDKIIPDRYEFTGSEDNEEIINILTSNTE